jgi:hypothetical protein
MNGIETVVEIPSRLRCLCAAVEARTTWSRLMSDDPPTVIHIDGNVTRESDSTFLGDGYGLLHGVDYPELGNTYHER